MTANNIVPFPSPCQPKPQASAEVVSMRYVHGHAVVELQNGVALRFSIPAFLGLITQASELLNGPMFADVINIVT